MFADSIRTDPELPRVPALRDCRCAWAPAIDNDLTEGSTNHNCATHFLTVKGTDSRGRPHARMTPADTDSERGDEASANHQRFLLRS